MNLLGMVFLTMLSSNSKRVLSDLGKGAIRGSTEAVKATLMTMKNEIMTIDSLVRLRDFIVEFLEKAITVRPTSALLVNSSRAILMKLRDLLKSGESLSTVKSEILGLIESLQSSAEKAAEEAAIIASRRIIDGDTIMTTSYSRTVIKTLKHAKEEGKNVKVIVTESRPRDDGLITASILSRMGIPTTLIIDSAVRFFMKDTTKILC